MTESIYSPLHKSVFRASGLALLSSFLITALSRLYASNELPKPGAILKLIDQILDQGPLLCMALLLLLLSLSDRILLPSEPGNRQSPGLRDRLLIRCRALVGLLAIVYLSFVPLTLLQVQTLNNMGDRMIERRERELRATINDVGDRIAPGLPGEAVAKGAIRSLSVAELKQRYPWANRPDIRTPEDMRALLRATRKNASRYYQEMRLTGRSQLRLESMRLCLLALLYAALIGYLWFQWPSRSRSFETWRRRAPGLGIELDATPEEA